MLNASLKFFIVLAGLMMINGYIFSQEDQIPVRDDYSPILPPKDAPHLVDLGIGLGLDYGGIVGFQLGVAPLKHLDFFAAGGYYLFQVGWQVGLKGLFISKTSAHPFRPFLKAMYGCNSVIAVDGIDDYDKVYTGFTVGLGLEFRFGKSKRNGFDADLNVPLRTPDFWDDYNRMKNDPRVSMVQGPIPVAASVGYHHEF